MLPACLRKSITNKMTDKMKTNYIKSSMLLIAALAIGISANAQQNDSSKHKYHMDHNFSGEEVTRTKDGKTREHIKTNWDDTYYDIILINNQMTELYVEDEKIPQAKW